jgi:hypothetical protein
MKIIKVIFGLLICGVLISSPSVAQEVSNHELLQELKAMKARVLQLETKLSEMKEEKTAKPERSAPEGVHGVKGLSDRVRRLEENAGQTPVLGKWAENITLSGAIEVEAGYENMNFAGAGVEDEDTSDIALAKVELGVDVDITEHVGGHVLFKDDTESIFVDEGFIILDGKDVLPLYLNLGKMFVPFGYFESHFISDPLTKALGETSESAIKVGYASEWMEACLAVFNGDIDEVNDDDHIKGFVSSVVFTLPEGTLPNVGVTLGASYISNIADSDGLEGETPGAVTDYVGGFGAFISASFMDRFFLEAEFVGAADEFEPGELSFDGGQALQPATWNLELAVALTDTIEVAARCEGADDLADFLPEIQYGAAVAFSLFENTALAFEYLHGEFENDDERDLLTTQLAVAF